MGEGGRKGLGNRLVGALVASVLATGLAACASTAPSALYGLNAPRNVEVAAARSSRQILVPQPSALQALDTTNIAVVDNGPVYTYFPRAAWSDTLPKVVQAKIIETLENTGRLRGVGRPGEGLLIDYQLQTDLRAFELRIDGHDRAYVEIAARLLDDRSGRARESRVFSAEVPSRGVNVDQAVEAMNAAVDQVLSEMAAWVLRQV
ncbi:membrane integrity-associated transporter subunit PqiC [Rhizobiales bacterium]|nr:membrane integrity-associated transporter subunit PqiC [Hongsoonwoonella zoysiae]